MVVVRHHLTSLLLLQPSHAAAQETSRLNKASEAAGGRCPGASCLAAEATVGLSAVFVFNLLLLFSVSAVCSFAVNVMHQFSWTSAGRRQGQRKSIRLRRAMASLLAGSDAELLFRLVGVNTNKLFAL